MIKKRLINKKELVTLGEKKNIEASFIFNRCKIEKYAIKDCLHVRADYFITHLATRDIRIEGVFCKPLGKYIKHLSCEYTLFFASMSSRDLTGALYMNPYFFFENTDEFIMHVCKESSSDPILILKYKTDKKDFLKERILSYFLLGSIGYDYGKYAIDEPFDLYKSRYLKKREALGSEQYNVFFDVFLGDAFSCKSRKWEESDLNYGVIDKDAYALTVTQSGNYIKDTYYTIRLINKEGDKYFEMYKYLDDDWFNDHASIFMRLMR